MPYGMSGYVLDGFWQGQDYRTIIAPGQGIPENTLQEDRSYPRGTTERLPVRGRNDQCRIS